MSGSARFTGGKLIGFGVRGEDYGVQTVERGHPAYVVSRSDLTRFAACPHKWLVGEPDESTEATAWGTLIDSLLFGCDVDRIAVAPETYTDAKGAVKPWNWNGGECKAWKEAHAGRVIVKADTMEAASEAVATLRARPEAAALLECSHYQAHVEADYHAGNGAVIRVKGLLDIVPTGNHARFGCCLGDLKTCASASLWGWKRAVFDRGYHVQAALYMDLWNAQIGEGRNTFLHLLSESESPYEPACRMLDWQYIALGRAQYQTALDLYADCLAAKRWPGYDEGEGNPALPGWAMVSPEPWMMMQAGVSPENLDTMGD